MKSWIRKKLAVLLTLSIVLMNPIGIIAGTISGSPAVIQGSSGGSEDYYKEHDESHLQ